MTRRKLFLTIALVALIAAALSGATASRGDPYFVEVDTVNQITTVYRRSDNAVVRQMICSTGVGNATPLGVFQMEQTRPDTDRVPWYYITGYRCYVKYATRIRGSILFHSIPYQEKSMAAIDAEALARLGEKASHGCIRLRWQDAEWIAKNCPVGTTVDIRADAVPRAGLRRALLEEGYSADSGLTYRQYLRARNESPDGLIPGDRGEAVEAMQARLIGLGFFGGDAPTGVYDAATVAAVTRFQAAALLPATGVATRALIERIAAEDAPRAEYATLIPGCSGPLVATVQEALRAVGFYDGAIDGVYGEALRRSARAYCRATGVALTERITPDFRAGLYALRDALVERYGSDGFSMAVVDGVAHWGIPVDAAGVAPMSAETLGTGVMALKKRLQRLGYYDGAITPVYDEATAAAVSAWQTAHGVTADGIASLEAQRAIFDSDD